MPQTTPVINATFGLSRGAKSEPRAIAIGFFVAYTTKAQSLSLPGLTKPVNHSITSCNSATERPCLETFVT